MKLREYKVLGHKVSYNVPESSEEFNKLDPKRPDAANEEATANIVYRSMNPETRYTFLHGRAAVEATDGKPAVEAIVGVEEETGIARKTKVVTGKDGKPRVKDGTEVTKFDEPEEEYYDRVIAQLVNDKKFASEETARAHFEPLIIKIASEVPFDVTQAERSDRGPVKLPARYKITAALSITRGTVDRVNEQQLSKIGKSFAPVNDTSKMFTGTETLPTGDVVTYNVSDKDAETYGRLIQEYFAWEAEQKRAAMNAMV